MNKTMTAALLALLTLGHAAAQTTSPPPDGQQPGGGVQQVHDKDVFEQNKAILQRSTEVKASVENMNATVQKALTRSKAFGGVANTAAVRMTIPDDGETEATIDTLFQQVKQMGCASTGKDSAPLPPKQLALCQKVEKAAYDMVKMLRANLARSKQRAGLIDQLLAQLDQTGAGNLKDSADLANRIQVETALLQNEKNMVDMALANNDQQMRLYNQLLVSLDKDSAGDPAGNSFSVKK